MAGLILGFLLLGAGCVSSRGDVNRVTGGSKSDVDQEVSGHDHDTQLAERVILYHRWHAAAEELTINHIQPLIGQEGQSLAFVGQSMAGMSVLEVESFVSSADDPTIMVLHGGNEVRNLAARGLLEPVGTLAREAFHSGFDKPIKELNLTIESLITFEGLQYAAPLGIHRTNLVWYSPRVFNRLGILDFDPSHMKWRLDEFLNTLNRTREADLVPLFLSTNGWGAAHLFDVVLYSIGGKEFYEIYWRTLQGAESREFREALEFFDRLMSYTSQEHRAIGPQDGWRLLREGKVAMLVGGDWGKGILQANGWETMPVGGGVQADWINADFSAFPFPVPDRHGWPQGRFLAVVESATVLKTPGHPDEAKAVVKALSSLEGQTALSNTIGTLPTRKPSALPDRIALENYYDLVKFAPAEFVPSGLYGGQGDLPASVIEDWVQNVNAFVDTRDFDAAIQAFRRLAEKVR